MTPVTTPALFTAAMPVLADIHGLAAAGVPDPLNVVVDPLHNDKTPVIVGKEFTVTDAVLLQPLLFVYVMIAVPGFTPVTTPPLVTVATVVFDDVQGLTVAGVPEPVSVVVAFLQTDSEPVMVGCALTVIVTLLIQPLLFVYVITVVPGLIPVTIPALFTVAIPVLDEDHGLLAAGVPDPVNVIVEFLQTARGPEMDGNALTVIVTELLQPLLFVYVIIAVPALFPVTAPVFVTEAIPGADEIHGFTAAGVPEPDNVVVPSSQIINVPVIVG